MTREEAIRLMAVYEAVTSALNPAFSRPCAADEAESERLTRAHGDLVWHIFENYMAPIIRQYPDLDPDGIQANLQAVFPKPE